VNDGGKDAMKSISSMLRRSGKRFAGYRLGMTSLHSETCRGSGKCRNLIARKGPRLWGEALKADKNNRPLQGPKCGRRVSGLWAGRGSQICEKKMVASKLKLKSGKRSGRGPKKGMLSSSTCHAVRVKEEAFRPK